MKLEWQKSPAPGPVKQTAKLGLVWRNKKKISQIINAYLYLPFFLLIILWLYTRKINAVLTKSSEFPVLFPDTILSTRTED